MKRDGERSHSNKLLDYFNCKHRNFYEYDQRKWNLRFVLFFKYHNVYFKYFLHNVVKKIRNLKFNKYISIFWIYFD